MGADGHDGRERELVAPRATVLVPPAGTFVAPRGRGTVPSIRTGAVVRRGVVTLRTTTHGTHGTCYFRVTNPSTLEEPVASPRRAAVVGANRIPFARSNGAYARASNKDMLTAALDGLVARFGLADERVGEVVAGAVLKHSRDFNLTREAVLAAGSRPGRPPTTSSRHAAPASRPRSSSPTRSPSGRSSRAWPVASTPPVTPRSPSTRTSARSCWPRTGRSPRPGWSRPSPVCARARSSPRSRANREPGTGMSMGEHAALTAAHWGIERTAQDELTALSHQNLAEGLRRRVLRRPDDALPRAHQGQQPARRLHASRSSASSSRSSSPPGPTRPRRR